jgi:hypothetical protein
VNGAHTAAHALLRIATAEEDGTITAFDAILAQNAVAVVSVFGLDRLESSTRAERASLLRRCGVDLAEVAAAPEEAARVRASLAEPRRRLTPRMSRRATTTA